MPWRSTRVSRLGIAITALACFHPLTESHALPSYARQTGQNCVACHAGGQFPELSPFGRFFKLTGYTIGTRAVPLSVMGLVSNSRLQNTTNDGVVTDFPKDRQNIFQFASVFYGAKFTDNIGAFIQYTYNNYDHQDDNGKWRGLWASDNADIRWADHWVDEKRDLIVGATLNNNPTVQDVWNSAPAWSYPYLSSAFAITPAAAPLISSLGAQVAGIGAYALWNRTIYGELTGYRTANGIWSLFSHGIPDAAQTKVNNVAPYWRFAWTKDWGANSLMLGTTGLHARVYPDPLLPSGPTNRFNDIGVDAQYQYILDPHAVSAQISMMREKVDWAQTLVGNGVDNGSDTLRQYKVRASYVYRAKYGGNLTWFSTTGSTDVSLYQGLDASNISGNPASRGWSAEVFWHPLQYARVGAQFLRYDKFNGASTNYDGAGRDAKHNNLLFLYVWFTY